MAGLDWLFQGTPTYQNTALSSTTGQPDWYQELIRATAGKAVETAGQGFTQYPGQRLAGFNQDQLNAFNLARQNTGAWQPNLQAAAGAAQGILPAATSMLGAGAGYATDAANAASGAQQQANSLFNQYGAQVPGAAQNYAAQAFNPMQQAYQSAMGVSGAYAGQAPALAQQQAAQAQGLVSAAGQQANQWLSGYAGNGLSSMLGYANAGQNAAQQGAAGMAGVAGSYAPQMLGTAAGAAAGALTPAQQAAQRAVGAAGLTNTGYQAAMAAQSRGMSNADAAAGSANALAGQYGGALSALAGQYGGPGGLSAQTAPYAQSAMSAISPSTAQWSNAARQQYMSPYTTGVTNEIARLGNRNLQENVLGAVNDSFIGSGGFGSSRNAEMIGRAMRDAQADISGKQAMALESGYNTALQGFQTDQARLQQQQQMRSGAALGAGQLQGNMATQGGQLGLNALQAAGQLGTGTALQGGQLRANTALQGGQLYSGALQNAANTQAQTALQGGQLQSNAALQGGALQQGALQSASGLGMNAALQGAQLGLSAAGQGGQLYGGALQNLAQLGTSTALQQGQLGANTALQGAQLQQGALQNAAQLGTNTALTGGQALSNAALQGGQLYTNALQNTAQLGAQTALQGGQQAANAAAQAGQIYNTGAQIGTAAADSSAQRLGALAQMQQQLGAADVGALGSVGGAQQGLEQLGYDTGYQNFLEQRGWNWQTLNNLNSILRGMQLPTTTTGVQQTPVSAGVSPLQWIGGLYGLNNANAAGGQPTVQQ